MGNLKESQLKLLVEVLNHEKNITQIWIHRKEIFVWAVLIFYLAGLWTVFSAVSKGDATHSTPLCAALFSIILLFWIAVSVLIRTNFGSLYYSAAKQVACNRLLYAVIENDEFFKVDFGFGGGKGQPNFIDGLIEEQRNMNRNWPRVRQ